MKYSKNDVQCKEQLVECLKKGGVVIVPTDTVYGFSGIVDLKGENFCTDCKIREIKGRSETKPLITLISKPEDIYLYTDDKIPEKLMKLWPGALTVIVNLKKDNPLNVNLKTVAFRCPGDLWLRQIIEESGHPLYSTSVNRSGKPVLDEEKLITDEFEKEADLIVLDGDRKGSVPSTLVSIADGELKIIRQGEVVIS